MYYHTHHQSPCQDDHFFPLAFLAVGRLQGGEHFFHGNLDRGFAPKGQVYRGLACLFEPHGQGLRHNRLRRVLHAYYIGKGRARLAYNQKKIGAAFGLPRRSLDVTLSKHDHVAVDRLIGQDGCEEISHGLVAAQGLVIAPQLNFFHLALGDVHETTLDNRSGPRVDRFVPRLETLSHFLGFRRTIRTQDHSDHFFFLVRTALLQSEQVYPMLG